MTMPEVNSNEEEQEDNTYIIYIEREESTSGGTVQPAGRLKYPDEVRMDTEFAAKEISGFTSKPEPED